MRFVRLGVFSYFTFYSRCSLRALVKGRSGGPMGRWAGCGVACAYIVSGDLILYCVVFYFGLGKSFAVLK